MFFLPCCSGKKNQKTFQGSKEDMFCIKLNYILYSSSFFNCYVLLFNCRTCYEMFVLLIYVHTTHRIAIDENLNDEIFGNKCLPSHNPNSTPTNTHTIKKEEL